MDDIHPFGTEFFHDKSDENKIGIILCCPASNKKNRTLLLFRFIIMVTCSLRIQIAFSDKDLEKQGRKRIQRN